MSSGPLLQPRLDKAGVLQECLDLIRVPSLSHAGRLSDVGRIPAAAMSASSRLQQQQQQQAPHGLGSPRFEGDTLGTSRGHQRSGATSRGTERLPSSMRGTMQGFETRVEKARIALEQQVQYQVACMGTTARLRQQEIPDAAPGARGGGAERAPKEPVEAAATGRLGKSGPPPGTTRERLRATAEKQTADPAAQQAAAQSRIPITFRPLAIATMPIKAPSIGNADHVVEGFGGLLLHSGGSLGVESTAASTWDAGRDGNGASHALTGGQTTIVGLVPTGQTITHIDDDYELISSVRAYNLDVHTQQNASIRSRPPHSDMLQELSSVLAAVHPNHLVDTGGLTGNMLAAQREGQVRVGLPVATGHRNDYVELMCAIHDAGEVGDGWNASPGAPGTRMRPDGTSPTRGRGQRVVEAGGRCNAGDGGDEGCKDDDVSTSGDLSSTDSDTSTDTEGVALVGSGNSDDAHSATRRRWTPRTRRQRQAEELGAAVVTASTGGACTTEAAAGAAAVSVAEPFVCVQMAGMQTGPQPKHTASHPGVQGSAEAEEKRRRAACRPTANFLATERSRERRPLPGVRQPPLGHYHVRFSQVHPRVVGGYIAPHTSGDGVRADGAESDEDGGGGVGAARAGAPRADLVRGEAKAAVAAPSTPRTEADTRIDGDEGAGRGEHDPAETEEAAAGRVGTAALAAPARVKGGSHMFVSQTERRVHAMSSPALHLDYWPFPDTRSTVHRTWNGTNFAAMAPAATAPAGGCRSRVRRRGGGRLGDGGYLAYPTAEVDRRGVRICGVESPEALRRGGEGARRLPAFPKVTGRDQHWFGKPPSTETQLMEQIDAEKAYAMTRPTAKAAHMAPRRSASTNGSPSRGAGTAGAHATSIECDLNFPPDLVGTAAARAGKRLIGFDVALPRWDAALPSVQDALYEADYAAVDRRESVAIIHPRAPGHQPLHNGQASEIGPLPSLRLVRPTAERAAFFGSGSATAALSQPHAHDLSYDVAKPCPVVEPRVKGNPMIDTIVSRAQRAAVSATSGCGVSKFYDGKPMPSKVKLVPVFQRQVARGQQFVGHRVQSESWMAKNPASPGPGAYNASYALVE